MKKFTLVTMAAFAVTASTSMAQPPSRGNRGGSSDDRVVRMMNYDEDEDGKLSRDEVPERLRGLFTRADENEDGQLTRDEISAAFDDRDGGDREGGERGRSERGREGGGRGREGNERGMDDGSRRDAMPPNPIFQALDANHDGELSADEINNATAALKKLDRNKNGKLEMAEVGPQARGGERGRGQGGSRPEGGPNGGDAAAFILDRHDSNNDGKLSKDEMPEFMQRGMAEHDKNDDGVLDKSEIETMTRRFRERGGLGRDSGRGAGSGGRSERGREGGERKRPPIEE